MSRQLGFQRVGPVIRQRIEAVLAALKQSARVRVSDPDGRVWMNAPAAG